jgi:hypothetical protein
VKAVVQDLRGTEQLRRQTPHEGPYNQSATRLQYHFEDQCLITFIVGRMQRAQQNHLPSPQYPLLAPQTGIRPVRTSTYYTPSNPCNKLPLYHRLIMASPKLAKSDKATWTRAYSDQSVVSLAVLQSNHRIRNVIAKSTLPPPFAVLQTSRTGIIAVQPFLD